VASEWICITPIRIYGLHGMKMGATNSRSRQTSTPGYRLLEETRLWTTRDVISPLSKGGEKRRRRIVRSSVRRPIGQFLCQVTNLAGRRTPRGKKCGMQNSECRIWDDEKSEK
jgi:hypothetical protein